MGIFKGIFTKERQEIISFWGFLLSLSLSNIYLAHTEMQPILWLLAGVVLPISVYAFLLTLAQNPAKPYLCLIWMLAFNAFQIVVLYLFGRSPIAVDMFLNVATTNPSESLELLENLVLSLVFTSIFYLLCIVQAVRNIISRWQLPQKFRMRMRKISLWGMGVGAALLAAACISQPQLKITNEIWPINVYYNLYTAVKRYHAQKNYPETSKNFTFNAKAGHDSGREIYVFVIGETSRAMNYSIYGYDRPTTPCLEAMSNLYVFRDALTQSNTTHKSVPMMLSAVNAEAFNEILRQKSVITAFKEAGFKTYFFSNQQRNGSFIDYFGEEADVCRFLKDDCNDLSKTYDTELLKPLAEELNNDTSAKKLIVLHTYGSHFNYKDRYPAEFAYFQPDNVLAASKSNKPELINAYDNTVRFIDHILGEVVKLLGECHCPAAMIYASDHGEDMFDDDREKFLHASPVPTFYQIRVPCAIWLSDEYQAANEQKAKQMGEHINLPINTTRVIFHTLMHLADIQSPFLDTSNALSSDNFTPKQRIYLNDHNEPCRLNEIIEDQRDIRLFKQDTLQFP